MNRIQTSTLKRSSGRLIVLWGASEKEVPPDPGSSSLFPAEDERHWYAKEYAGWNTEKVNIPDSPRDGAKGKKVLYLQPGRHSYMDEYADSLRKKAEEAGIDLQILGAGWDEDLFGENVRQAIGEKPDLILLNPENQQKSSIWYRMINEAGIPVIGGNFLPDSEGFRYLLAWTGPDDWGQSRLLARSLAERMHGRGNYAILQHLEGTSSYYARTWGVISELKKQAPGMRCLDYRSPGIGMEDTAGVVREWLARYGDSLNAIVSADDEEAMAGVARVLKEEGRQDIVCVAAGSSRTGLELIRDGALYAAAYQSAAVDGNTAMQTVIDWFEGVPVEPIRYLPRYIITRDEVTDFLEVAHRVDSINLEHLYRSIGQFDWEGVYNFFGDMYEKFLNTIVIPREMFQGFCLEVLTGLIHLIKTNGLPVEETVGSYENMVKHLLRDEDIGSVLEWLIDLSQTVIRQLMLRQNRKTPIQEIIEYIEEHYREPLSLKSLSWEFNLSQVYLGQLFRKETGVKFNDYLNRKRIDAARLLLAGENVKANAVALEVGYSDPAYFYKIFKKYTDISITDYMKKFGDTR